MQWIILLALLLAVLAVSTHAAYCNGVPDPGERTNTLPTSASNLKRVRSVKNGVLYHAGPENARFPVVHVYGSAYEMGYAQGELMGKDLSEFTHGVFHYLIDELGSSLPDKYPEIPDFLKEVILKRGIIFALDLTIELTKPYTPASFYEELQGIADAVPSVSFQTILRLQMLPEVTKAACSFFGSWGPASKGGKTLHMRSLDYDTDGPFRNFPQVTVYHPAAGGGNAFANVGWPGTVGSLTGMNDQRMSINEIGVSYPDDSFGQGTPDTPPEKLKGTPWMLVVRNMLQGTSTLDAALQSVEQAHRTCNLILGVSDGKAGHVYGIQYGGRVFNAYDDTNQLPVNATWHPVVPNMVYNGMDWLCPGYTSVLGAQLGKYRTVLEPANIIGNVLPTVQTGNLHIAVYDLTEDDMYLSFCRSAKANASEPMYAYERQFTQFHMSDLWNEPMPSL